MNGLSREYIIHPGETIRELLEDREMTQKELAIRSGVTPKHISEVLNGNASITPRFAAALEDVFGASASFWLNLQSEYDIDCIKLKSADEISENELSIVDKLKDISKYMLSLGLLNKGLKKEDKVLFYRRFLSVSNLTSIPSLSFNAAFRAASNVNVDPYVLYGWIKICEVLSEKEASTDSLDVDLLKESIPQIKSLMLLGDINAAIAQMTKIFASCGIKFKVVHHITGAPVHGFIEKTANGDMILILTIRGKFADKFWFTLFHEIAHVLNGDVEENSRFIDYDFSVNESEQLANDWAGDTLLNRKRYDKFVSVGDFSISAISNLAARESVFPGIVIGRLQKEGHIPYSSYVSYKLKYAWKES